MVNDGKTGGVVFAPMSISDNDFNRLVNFVQTNYGINLTQKRQLITGRLSTTIRQRGYANFTEFVDHLLVHIRCMESIINLGC